MNKIETVTIDKSMIRRWGVQHPTLATPSGEEIEDDYQQVMDNYGVKHLEKSGCTNVYDKIQASLESTKIENVVKRYEMGDPNALNQRAGQYLDLSETPTSLIDAMRHINHIKEKFDQLPIDIRREYNFDPEQLLADWGSEKFNNLMGVNMTEPEIKPEVKSLEKEDKNNGTEQ